MRTRLFATIMKSALAALFLIPVLRLSPALAAEIFAREPLAIVTASGAEHKFTVELALTPAQREKGLMFRRMMGENEGMLFDFQGSRIVTMWMRNTPLPLDMLFMDEKGRINHLHENAEPYSETIIPSGDPVRFVLELNGGTIDRLDIAEGDRVRSAQIDKAR
jgi:uncharacterized membrane protein (UPF0127 family)